MIPVSIKKIPQGVRQTGIFCGWIAGIILLGGLFWFFTQPVRNQALIRSANRVLQASGENIRLAAVLPSRELSGRAARLGTWFSLYNSSGRGVIFPVMNGGIQIPFLGLVSVEGQVDAVIPLGGYAVTIAARLPPGTLAFYIKRIEGGTSFPKQEVP